MARVKGADMPMFGTDQQLAEFNRLVGEDERLRQRALEAADRALERCTEMGDTDTLAGRDHVWSEAAIEAAHDGA